MHLSNKNNLNLCIQNYEAENICFLSVFVVYVYAAVYADSKFEIPLNNMRILPLNGRVHLFVLSVTMHYDLRFCLDTLHAAYMVNCVSIVLITACVSMFVS